MSDIITIDLSNLEKLVQDADKILMEPDGEQVLVDLLSIRDRVEDAIKRAKEKLSASALAINPDFKSVQADRVKVSFRAYTARYGIDQQNLDQLPEGFYKKTEVVRYTANSKEIDKFYKAHGALPLGVYEREREKKLSFDFKDRITKEENGEE